MLEFDVIVVGAGPSGSAAAIWARRFGLSVALVDRAVFPRDKLCGGLITGRSLRELDQIFGLGPGDPVFLRGGPVSFRWGDRELARCEPTTALHFTMRRDFDARLCDQACLAGATLFTSAVQALDMSKGVVRLENGEQLASAVIVGADGVNSAVARHLFGRAYRQNRIGFGLEVELPATDPQRMIAIDFDAANWGYGWVFPKVSGTTVGVGGVLVRNGDLKPALRRLLPQGCTGRIKGQFIPFGDFRRRPGRGRVLLVGDAAGLVDPITGEGIALALASGRLAAEVAAEVVKNNRPETALATYLKRLKPLHDELSRARRLRRLIFSPLFRGRFRRLLAQSTEAQKAMFDLLDGQTTYRTLERRAVASVLRRALKAVWIPR